MEEIKTHAFFQQMDWKALEALKLEPPYHPRMISDEDVQAFDHQFTSMTPRLTPVDCGGPASIRNYFSGFTFYT